MSDPLGLIGSGLPLQQRDFSSLASAGRTAATGPDFKTFLQEQIAQVNALQQDAKEAVEDLATGRRDDMESVIIATQKADAAFRMLLAVRNKMMDAYQEIKELRV